MSDFDKAVKKAKIESGFNDKVQTERGNSSLLKKSKVTELPTPKSPIEYKITDDGYSQEVWPVVFKWVPKTGDMVESQSGRTLRINSLTYKIGGIVQIALGRETGGISPSGGGGSAEEDLL